MDSMISVIEQRLQCLYNNSTQDLIAMVEVMMVSGEESWHLMEAIYLQKSPEPCDNREGQLMEWLAEDGSNATAKPVVENRRIDPCDSWFYQARNRCCAARAKA